MSQLIFDPLLPWDGPFPYAVLARLGVTPQSTSTQVLDASYTIVAEAAADQRLNDAWESLRLTARRLLADFFCYQIDAPAPAAPAEPPHNVPWGLIETLARIDRDITLPLRPAPAPNLPAHLTDTPPLWEPGIDPKENSR